LTNGVYLYGKSPQPNQLLHNYIVFEQQNGQVIGAFYSPRLSGAEKSQKLDAQGISL